MYAVLLEFSHNRAQAPQWMDGHNAWLRQGFDDGVFMLAGSMRPGRGGAILAHGTTPEALEARLQADPFVAHDVVRAEIIDIAPARVDERLAFLQG